MSSGSLSVLLSAISVGTSLSGYGIIVGLPLGTIGGFCGLVSVSTGLYLKKLNKKITKHEKTSTIARTKINSLQDLISKGLSDGKLSEEEFSRIQKEAEKYETMKLEIRKSQRKEIGRSEINLLIKNSRKFSKTRTVGCQIKISWWIKDDDRKIPSAPPYDE